VDWLLPPRCEVAVDLAAGTGLLSRALAGRVPEVIAVEPDERMAAVLRARSPGVRVLRGTGESIPLDDAQADGVFVSSAWHWFDPERAVPEIARVLRDGGRLGLLWTTRDREVPWVRSLDLQHDSPGPGRVRHREIILPDTGLFGPPVTASFRFTRPMTIEGIVDMLATYSGVITAEPGERAAALAYARDRLEQQFPGAGEIDVPMRAWCWRADRVTRA
jgi:SAM-dependent methyltransferase